MRIGLTGPTDTADETMSLVYDKNDECPWGSCRSTRYIDVQRATVWTRP